MTDRLTDANVREDDAQMDAFLTSGFLIADDVLTTLEIDTVKSSLELLDTHNAGTRKLLELPWCGALAERVRSDPVVGALLPTMPVAIQCTLFDKSADKNWLVALHQDLAVPVKERVSSSTLKVWSKKEGGLFVQPPTELLQQLVAVRISIDGCNTENGALRVVPGSHLSGRLSQADVAALKARVGETWCEVRIAGAMVFRPLLLHASSKAVSTRRRRVLHFLFAPSIAGYGLKWQYSV